MAALVNEASDELVPVLSGCGVMVRGKSHP
jgi:hypothetical protein